MKKSNLVKVFSILVISLMVALVFATTVNADNTTDLSDDMLRQLTGNNTTGSNTTAAPTTNRTGNTVGGNVIGNTTSTNRTNTINTTNTTSRTNTVNTSVYTNTDLPNTGIDSPIPVAILIVVFGISSVYAYKKINDYKNL